MPQLRILFSRLGRDRLLTFITVCGLVAGIRIGERSMEQDHIMSVGDAFIQMFGVESRMRDLKDLEKPNTVFRSLVLTKETLLHLENNYLHLVRDLDYAVRCSLL